MLKETTYLRLSQRTLKVFRHTVQFFWSHLHTHAVGELFCIRFPTIRYHFSTVELSLKGILFCTRLGSNGSLIQWFARSQTLRLMLMSPNKGEATVHGCHCRGDMVVRMRKVMAIPRSWYVCFSAKIDIESSQYGSPISSPRSKCSLNPVMPMILFIITHPVHTFDPNTDPTLFKIPNTGFQIK